MLDPFDGTTALAAVELGHTATLIELNLRGIDGRCRAHALRPSQRIMHQIRMASEVYAYDTLSELI